MYALPKLFATSKLLPPAPKTGSKTPLTTSSVESGKPVVSADYPSPERVQHKASPASNFTLPREPEDARITGGTRSLDRRLLALNLSRSLNTGAERSPTAPAATASVDR
jgi:hypothetical protein